MFCSCNDSTSGHQSHDETKLKQCSGIALTLSFLISSAVFLPLHGERHFCDQSERMCLCAVGKLVNAGLGYLAHTEVNPFSFIFFFFLHL